MAETTGSSADTWVGLLLLAGVAGVALLSAGGSVAAASGTTSGHPPTSPPTSPPSSTPSGYDGTPYTEFELSHEPVGYFGTQYNTAQEAATAAWDASHPPASTPQPTSCTARDWYVGTTGGCVQEIQRLLNEEIAAGLAVDGIFGPLTRQAVVDFQTSQGISADGVVGPQTWSRLLHPSPGGGGGGGGVRFTP